MQEDGKVKDLAKEVGGCFKRILAESASILVPGIIAMAFTAVFVRFYMSFVYIPTQSMEPTYMAGTVGIEDKAAYWWSRVPERGDVIIFRQGNRNLCKRIIGVPGDTVTITGNKVYIDGKLLEEPYLPEGTETAANGENNEFVVPKGEYFVMGDNRANSYDSRYWAYPFVKEKDVGGKFIGSPIVISKFVAEEG